MDGTHPSLPSSSETFHQIPCFSPVGYSSIPGSRSRTISAFWSGPLYMRPGFAIVTACATLSSLAFGASALTSLTSFVKASR